MSEITVNVKIDAPGLAAAIAALTTALSTQTINIEAPEVETAKPEPEATEPTEAKEPEITLETVRAKLATLAQGGKQAEVKALIAKFGAKKLTDIAVAKYPELLAAAEGL